MTDSFLSAPQTKVLTSLFLILFFFSQARAQTTSPSTISLTNSTNLAAGTARGYEVALVIPWEFVEQSINPKTNDQTTQYQFPMNNISLTAQGIPFVISQTNITVGMHLKSVTSSGNVTNWETDQLAIQADVGAFSLQKDITQTVNGVQVIVHLQASCSPFTLVQANAHSIMQWDWTLIDGQVSAGLAALSLDWTAGTWQVGNLQCTGPAGFADLVQQEIQQQLADAQPFIPTIKSLLEQKLNQTMAAETAVWKKPQWLQAGVSLQVTDSGVVSSKGLLYKGLLHIGDPNVAIDPGQVIPLQLSDELLAKTADQPTVIFSKAAIQDLVRQQNLWPTVKTNLNSISGFVSLLKSRFIQFFVWPDLWNYSKTAPFQMVTNIASAPSLTFGSGNSLYVEGPLSSWVLSQRGGQTWNYIHLTTQLKTWMNYYVQSGTLLVKTQTPSLDTTAAFGADYIKKYHPITHLSVSTMQKALEESAQNQQSTTTIPVCQLSDTMKLQATGLSQPEANYFFMTWAAVP